mmetsp:Transcript_35665/g.41292  ORF Transcript_35665/g.41292 Transcript_35665/m.41292 type:complete len:625 (+) Transcript_35665:1364-3238(+)
MWLWVVESVETDLFNSITVVERILKKCRCINGRDVLRRIDQIDMLEVVAVSLFGVLSLRFCNPAEQKGLCFMIPKENYFNWYLREGDYQVQCRGFGCCLKEAISKACHKHFFSCFAKVVHNIEFITGFIVMNNLLQVPPTTATDEHFVRFERTIYLSSFICCNAVVFEQSGVDSTPEEADADSNKIPKIPLTGNIASLVKVLREAVTSCKSSLRLQESFKSIEETSSFLDLFLSTKNLLKESSQDQIILCCIDHCDTNDVVNTSPETDEFEYILKKIPFHESHFIFSDTNLKSHNFLKVEDVCNIDTSHLSPDDADTLSRKSEERQAALVITMNMRSCIERKSKLYIDPGTYFRKWKETLEKLVPIVKKWIGSKKETTTIAPISFKHNTMSSEVVSYPLWALEKRWNQENFKSNSFNKWRKILMDYMPVFDAVGCGFCQIVNDSFMHQERTTWIHTNCSPSHSPWKCAIAFNNVQKQAGLPLIPRDTDATFYHSKDSRHKTNMLYYNNHIDQLSKLMSQLDISRLILDFIVRVCDVEGQKGNSWYLNVGEVARMMVYNVEDAVKHSWRGIHWPPHPYFLESYKNLTTTSLQTEIFYLLKCEEETVIMQRLEMEKRGKALLEDQA